jgi:hypothetical protein
MDSKSIRPAWWKLYLIVPLLVALLVLDAESSFSAIGHEFMELGAMVLVCGLAAHWVRANRRALVLESREEASRQETGTKWPLSYPHPVPPLELQRSGNCQERYGLGSSAGTVTAPVGNKES